MDYLFFNLVSDMFQPMTCITLPDVFILQSASPRRGHGADSKRESKARKQMTGTQETEFEQIFCQIRGAAWQMRLLILEPSLLSQMPCPNIRLYCVIRSVEQTELLVSSGWKRFNNTFPETVKFENLKTPRTIKAIVENHECSLTFHIFSVVFVTLCYALLFS